MQDSIGDTRIGIDFLGGQKRLPTVAAYRHVGITIGEYGSCSNDVAIKSASIQQVARSYRAHVVGNRLCLL